ncbi:histidine ammonia-lyase [Actinoplanes sp. OR16]|uniref:aromatic amino acid lyase n=1 Tax=Actinoplanes sp. OR16 TaxID=946334 RepID=UPI000F6DB46E|nr:aromatic amino acid lyase [Actinoplanes sp. OR16]BBH70970.1 histidine ammonia-lyase [Actinoplanes sp. OR16]
MMHRIRTPEDLTPAVIAGVARGTITIVLDAALLARVRANRTAVEAALAGDQPVYGVNTGMGALAGIRLDAGDQERHQNTLMAGRSVGSAPWLREVEARALVAVRLRTLLEPAAGASPDLCRHLAALLDAGVTPAIPARGSGAAGEIIPLAHAGAALIGIGQMLDGDGNAVDAGPALEAAGLRPYSFSAKEGVAFLEGVPGLTGLAVLAADAARTLTAQVTEVVAAEHAVARASLDPWHPAFGAGDAELRTIMESLEAARGDGPPGALQAPVSFRVSAPALAVATRAAAGLEAAVDRALTCVTDSPAFLGGRFVGSPGFAGTDLVTAAGTLATALVHLAELGAARLHRLLDPHVTGLTRQLSDAPGVHAGMVAVHKRSVGVAHRLRRFAATALIGPIETSAGQEDVQSFTFEAAESLTECLTGLREVLACEILALHQAHLLTTSRPGTSGAPPSPGAAPSPAASLSAGAAPSPDDRSSSTVPPASADDTSPPLAPDISDLSGIWARLPQQAGDRPFGRDLDLIIGMLEAGR